MKLASPAFGEGQSIPRIYTCDGEGISPPLQFLEVPSTAQSLTLIVEDPDAPAGTWVHWVVYNIAPTTTEVVEHTVPTGGKEGRTSFGNASYGGPCPPSGSHRYVFTLYALDTILEFQAEDIVNNSTVQKQMEGHILDSAQLRGIYSRK